MRIILKDDEPVYQRARRLSAAETEEIRSKNKRLNEVVIRPSSSDYVNPINLVKKKDGNTRICCDCRNLNEKIVKDHFPLHIIEIVLNRLLEGNLSHPVIRWFPQDFLTSSEKCIITYHLSSLANGKLFTFSRSIQFICWGYPNLVSRMLIMTPNALTGCPHSLETR